MTLSNSLLFLQHLLPQIYSQLMTCFIFYWQSWSHRKEFPHAPTPTCTNLLALAMYVPSLFLAIDELSMLLYKANDSTWALNLVPSLLLIDIASKISLSLCFTMKLSFFTAHSYHHTIIGISLYCKTPWKNSLYSLSSLAILQVLLNLFKLLSALPQSRSY